MCIKRNAVRECVCLGAGFRTFSWLARQKRTLYAAQIRVLKVPGLSLVMGGDQWRIVTL